MRKDLLITLQPSNLSGGDAQPHQVQVTNLSGTDADYDELIIDSGIEMTVNYISLGASGTDSYLTLEEGAKLTFKSNDGIGLLISDITLHKGAVLTSLSTLYDKPETITFSNAKPSANEKFIVNASSSPAVIFNSKPSLPWLDDLMDQNDWHLASYSSGGCTLYDESDKIVTSFTVYNHSHKPQLEGVKEPTCTEAGYSGDLVCTSCGELIKEGATISAFEHNYENGKCTICGALDPDAPTPRPSVTPTPSATPTPSITPAPSATLVPSATPMPSVTPTPSVTSAPPSTGDAAPLALWLSLLTITGACLILAAVHMRRHSR